MRLKNHRLCVVLARKVVQHESQQVDAGQL